MIPGINDSKNKIRIDPNIDDVWPSMEFKTYLDLEGLTDFLNVDTYAVVDGEDEYHIEYNNYYFFAEREFLEINKELYCELLIFLIKLRRKVLSDEIELNKQWIKNLIKGNWHTLIFLMVNIKYLKTIALDQESELPLQIYLRHNAAIGRDSKYEKIIKETSDPLELKNKQRSERSALRDFLKYIDKNQNKDLLSISFKFEGSKTHSTTHPTILKVLSNAIKSFMETDDLAKEMLLYSKKSKWKLGKSSENKTEFRKWLCEDLFDFFHNILGEERLSKEQKFLLIGRFLVHFDLLLSEEDWEKQVNEKYRKDLQKNKDAKGSARRKSRSKLTYSGYLKNSVRRELRKIWDTSDFESNYD